MVTKFLDVAIIRVDVDRKIRLCVRVVKPLLKGKKLVGLYYFTRVVGAYSIVLLFVATDGNLDSHSVLSVSVRLCPVW